VISKYITNINQNICTLKALPDLRTNENKSNKKIENSDIKVYKVGMPNVCRSPPKRAIKNIIYIKIKLNILQYRPSS
jgi:hypothetical protein